MEEEVLKERWQDIKEEIKRYWRRLTDAEIEQINGEQSRLECALHERYGYTREQARQKVEVLILRGALNRSG